MAKKALRYSHNLLGIIKLKEGNLDDAVKELEEAKSLLPAEYDVDSGQAFFLYPLAMAYSDAGNKNAAQREYERIRFAHNQEDFTTGICTSKPKNGSLSSKITDSQHKLLTSVF